MTTESTGRPLAAKQEQEAGRGHRPLTLAVLSGALALDIGSLNIVNRPCHDDLGARRSATAWPAR